MTFYKHSSINFPLIKKVPNVIGAGDGQVLKDAKEELTVEALELFRSLNVEPSCLFYFCRGDKVSSHDKRVLHSDLTRIDPLPWKENDDPTKKVWKNIICGINWEITGSITEFTFWDTEKLEKFFPVRQGLDLKYDYLNSIHYIKRGNFGVPDQAVKLDQINISSKPVLIRTEIPHITTYSGPNIRIGASLRFKETWDTWDQALEIFAPILE